MRALVSGGSSGIGAATCVRLAEAALAEASNCRSRCVDIKRPLLKSRLSVQFSRWRYCIALVGNLSDPDVQVTGRSCGGRIWWPGWVGSNGIANPGAMCDLSVEDWDDMFLREPPRCVASRKASYPHLKRDARLRLFTSSMSGKQPHAGSGAYSHSKAALTC